MFIAQEKLICHLKIIAKLKTNVFVVKLLNPNIKSMRLKSPLSLPLLFLLLFSTCSLLGQPSTPEAAPVEYAQAVSSQDEILENLYAVISGEKGEARDWDKFRYLFHADAKLIPTRKTTEGMSQAVFWTVEDYIDRAGDYLVQQGFFEKEIHRETDSFGAITQVFSTYESYHSESEAEPFARGINSIQLLNDGERWWILNIYWTSESEAQPIPAEYLPE